MATDREILLATADLEACRRLTSLLSQWGFEPLCASTVDKAKAILARHSVDMVFCEDRLGDGGFRDVLSAARLMKSQACVVLTSRNGNGNGHLEAIQLGAFDVIPSPCRPADVHRVVLQAMRGDGRQRCGSALGETHEIKAFYDRWNPSVFRFCCLFLGYRDLAAECAAEAFLSYLREKHVLQTGALPSRLMALALAAVQRCSAHASQAIPPSEELPAKVLRIPSDQRAVFIMRSVLGMADSSVALAIGVPVESMRRLWRRSLLNLRKILPTGFFERKPRVRQSDMARTLREFLSPGEKPCQEYG